VDPSNTPWRTFDAPGSAHPGPDAPPAAIPRSSLLAGIGAIVLLVVGAAVLAAGAGGGRAVLVDASASVEPSAGAAAGVEAILVVDIAGAVVRPGVYRLPAGSRVGDAITAAGGYGPRVDAARVGTELNLAAPLTDGQHLAVPSRDDVALGGDTTGGNAGSGAGSGSSGGSPGSGSLVDLNRATSGELDALPGIGPVTAAKILAARESTPFVAVQDLLDRKLVGQKTFDGLRDLVTVN
jgi:competence protein ComEA